MALSTLEQQKQDKYYFGIFNSWDRLDDEVRKDVREGLAEANDLAIEDVPEHWVDDDINGWLDDEKENLNVKLNGHIVGYANLGLWDGRHTCGTKDLGTYLNDIFGSSYGGDDVEWYCDKYNLRVRAYHHDGTNCVLLRYVPTEDAVERLQADIATGKIKNEIDFMRRTKSLRPLIAQVYGLKRYGRQKRIIA